TVANIQCTVVPSCCYSCGSVFPARAPPIVVEPRQKNCMSPFCESDHSAKPNRSQSCHIEGRDLSENRPCLLLLSAGAKILRQSRLLHPVPCIVPKSLTHNHHPCAYVFSGTKSPCP